MAEIEAKFVHALVQATPTDATVTQDAQPSDAPMALPTGETAPFAMSAAATSAAEKNSKETPPDSCELGSIEPSFTDAERKAAVDEFLKLDAEVYTKADELVGEYQALMQRFNDELLPRCDRVQAFLSQRGPMHIPGLPSWTSWRDALLNFLQKKMKVSLSTFKRKLKEYQEGDDLDEITAGEPGEGPDEDTGTDNDPAPVVYESPKEQVTKWVNRQRKVLTGGDGPLDADPIRDGERRVDTSLQMLDELELAVDEGLLDGVEATSVSIPAMPMRPEITGEPVAEPAPDTLEGFRHQLFRIPDTRDMGNEVPLRAYLNRLAAQLLEGHPLAPKCQVDIHFSRPNGCGGYGHWTRCICIGDWLEYKGGNVRLTKQLGGKEIALGRVVDKDMLFRPCVRWFNGSEWIKPYSLFQEGRQVNVLFDYQAAEAYPDAFNSYPKEKEKKGRRTLTNKSKDTVEDDPVDDDIPAVPSAPVNKDANVTVLNAGFAAATVAAIDVPRPAAEAQTLVTIDPVAECIGLPGCTFIYAPAGQANEFAPLAANPYKGCGHGCTYCFNTTRKNPEQKATFHGGAVPRKNYLSLLLNDAKKYQAAGITEQVTLCFSTDAYNPFDTSLTRPTLEIIQQHGMGICVLTKGGTRALADIDLYRPNRDCFASTLTGLDATFVSKWEPSAASPDDRIAALKAFNKKGIYTWVSLEPTLNVEASLSVVEATHGFVNLYKIGKVNYCAELSHTIDWEHYTRRMIGLCQKLGVAHYIKWDLQPYLPHGYNNPMRVKQHN